MNTKLTIDDITDLRAYEREREQFRSHVIHLKKRRRVSVGPFVTLLFENRDTIRFQIQEMARAEKIFTDEGIQTELDVYNPLVPEPGTLRATMFIELTNEADLRQWLPRLVGIENALELRLPSGTMVRATPEEAHAAQLTRETITASVHYVGFVLPPDAAAEFETGRVALAVTHPNYAYKTELDETTIRELLADLRGA
jgi:hypothetical protein